MKANWTDGTKTLATIDDLDAVIATLKAGEPMMLFLEHESGTVLVVGFGGEETVLTFVEADGTSFHSLGESDREGFLMFWSDGQLQEFLAEMAVPACFAEEAVKLFFEDGKMPGNVNWEAD